MRDAFHAAGLVVVRAGRTPAQLLLLCEFIAPHFYLIGRFSGPLQQLGIRAVVGIVFIKHGPARHPGFGRELFKRRANHGQRAYHVLAHPAQNDSGVI
jgi:hypothetical protein